MSLNHQYIACILCILASVNTLDALSIVDSSSDTNDRFANDSSFIANSFDLSGIARTSNGKWLTMVSPNVFLSSHHYFPANDQSVKFYAGNDPDGDSLTRTVVDSQQIGTSDLRIGYLNIALSADYVFYNIESESDFVNYTYYNADAYLFGGSANSHLYSEHDQNMAIGRNKLNHSFNSINVQGTTDAAWVADFDQTSDPNFIEHEAMLEQYDSGAPMMVADAGQLTLVGVNWFILGNSNGFSQVGKYAIEINNFISLHAVPELSATAFYMSLFLTTIGLSSRRISLILHG